LLTIKFLMISVTNPPPQILSKGVSCYFDN
jgi:hypothetical protein